MWDERYDSTSGCGEDPDLEMFLLNQLFNEVKKNDNVKLQILGCDYICDGKWVDCKIDYYDSKRDFCFETVGRGGHSWTDPDHKTDYILYIKRSQPKEAFLINFEELQKFKLTKTFKRRKEFPCGDRARCKFFRLGEELPVEKGLSYTEPKAVDLKRAMSDDIKFTDEV